AKSYSRLFVPKYPSLMGMPIHHDQDLFSAPGPMGPNREYQPPPLLDRADYDQQQPGRLEKVTLLPM
ncbi:MAG: hypothetical protein ABI865_13405, partial [Nitrosospira sp.]